MNALARPLAGRMSDDEPEQIGFVVAALGLSAFPPVWRLRATPRTRR